MKRRKQEDSATNAVSFRLRDVTICMERTSQPEGVRFTIERTGDASSKSRVFVAGGRITNEESGIMLSLAWSEDATASEMLSSMGHGGAVRLAIGKPTSKSAGAR